MPAARPAGDALNAVFSDVVANDPEIRDEVRSIVRGIINQTRYLLVHGDTETRNQMMRAVMPGMVKALAASEGGERERKEREALDRILGKLNGSIDSPPAS